MATSRRNTSQRLTLIILILASVTAITLDYRGPAAHGLDSLRNGARDAVSPVQRILSDVFHPVGDFFSGAVNYSAVANENARLRNEVGQLRRQALQNENSEQQLQQVLTQLRLPYLQNSKSVVADVNEQTSASAFELTITIDRGTADGVGLGMPVVAGAGLIGTVIEAGSTTSVVRLIDDPGSKIGVRFTNGTIAVVSGQGRGEPISMDVSSSAPIPRKGQVVFTSGLQGAAYPAGIPVGTVSSVQSPKGGLTRDVSIQPVQSLTSLEFVAVVQWQPAA